MELTIDRGFKPNLLDRSNRAARELFDRWAIDPVGTPVASRHDTRAALWFSNVYNRFGEGITFIGSTAISPIKERETLTLDFYIGIVISQAIEEAEDPICLRADAAVHPLRSVDTENNLYYLAKELNLYLEHPSIESAI